MQRKAAVLCPGLPPAKVCPLLRPAPLGCLPTKNDPIHSLGGQKEYHSTEGMQVQNKEEIKINLWYIGQFKS